MSNYGKAIRFEERLVIQKHVKSGMSFEAIGKLLGRGKNTVLMEVRRSGGRENYNAKEAEESAQKRRLEHSEKVRVKNKNGGYNPFKHLSERVDMLQMQIDTLTEVIKEMREKHD